MGIHKFGLCLYCFLILRKCSSRVTIKFQKASLDQKSFRIFRIFAQQGIQFRASTRKVFVRSSFTDISKSGW